ncbi:MAG: glycoside hydrolase family 97 N-terminal domain-containing protein [Dysgonamonadaceae bacterium]|nr:glycoside hydrolase family 97 N-terminal domain-containing protein [Dysgonamonadaceae bacterium]
MTILLLLAACSPVFAAQNIAQLKSPDNTLTVDLLIDGTALFYTVSKNSEQIIEKSHLGINTSIGAFSSGLTFESVSISAVDETYTLPSGKRKNYINRCNEATAFFRKSDQIMQVIFRVYNDGVAYRYVLSGSGNVSIYSEASECNLPVKQKIYSQIYSNDYKNDFEETDWELAACRSRVALPVLVETNRNYVLISEAAVNGNYAGAQLTVNESNGAFAYKIDSSVLTALPLKTSWRTLLIGTLETIVESSLLENVNEATSISDISWIRPGRAAWNYGGEDTSGYLDLGNIKKYIDWAAEMGWEYFTLDKAWRSSLLNQVINYASSKQIGIFIWLNQSALPNDEISLRNILQGYKNQGVKGLKVDFWENESQNTLQKQDKLLALAAEHQLLLNFQSCAKPTGLRKKWPHLLTSEAVRGNVYYAANPEAVTAVHNINSAIFRNSLGATDYAPVDFAEKSGRLLQTVTWAHQLALSVVFESGIQHIMDAPDNIQYSIARDFLKKLPVAWDNSLCLKAFPEKHICIARQKNDDWYVASLTDSARTVELPLNFLSPDKTYHAYIYKDGDCLSEIRFEYRQNIRSTDQLNLQTLDNGGFTVIFSLSNNLPKPNFTKYEAESAGNEIPFGVATKTDPYKLASGNQYLSGIGYGRAVKFRQILVPSNGEYAVTFYYSSEENRYASIKTNDKAESVKEELFYGTAGRLAHKTILIYLDAGKENSIEFGNDGGAAPNLDRILISRTGNAETGIEKTGELNNTGKIYAIDRKIIVEQEIAAEFAVYNIMGQKLIAGKFAGGQISIPVENSGIYLVKIKTDEIEFVQKIIVK